MLLAFKGDLLPIMSQEKVILREQFKARRNALSEDRRVKASLALAESILPRLKSFNKVLSFSSAFGEIDTSPINQKLLSEDRLVLPRVFFDELKLYHIRSLEDLKLGSFGVLEPKDSCTLIDYNLIECAIVPGLAFDNDRHRLGYGKGFYDKLLAKTCAVSFGVGFIEQKSPKLLPKDVWDKPLTEVIFT